MFKLIKKGAKLSEENRPLLWTELGIFAVIPGLFFHAWLVTLILLPVLSWLITRPNGMFYMIFAISLIWSFIPFCGGYAWGGIVWAVIVAGLVFMWAVKVHVNGLKWQWDEIVYKSDDTIEWKQFSWSGPNGSQPLIK
jgi:hypothetical protein